MLCFGTQRRRNCACAASLASFSWTVFDSYSTAGRLRALLLLLLLLLLKVVLKQLMAASAPSKQPVLQPVTHVIFDLDGTLLDTERIFATVHQEICSRYGKTFSWDIKSAIMGRPEPEAVRIIKDTLKLPVTVEEIMAESRKKKEDLYPKVDLMPGAEKLIRHFQRHQVPIAMASSSSQEAYNLKKTRYQELFGLLHHIVLGDDPEIKNGKPAPDIFLICAKRFEPSVTPAKCLVFEDAPNGVEGARAAGMQVVMIPDENLPKELTKDATIVLSSMTEFKPELFGLPKFD